MEITEETNYVAHRKKAATEATIWSLTIRCIRYLPENSAGRNPNSYAGYEFLVYY